MNWNKKTILAIVIVALVTLGGVVYGTTTLPSGLPLVNVGGGAQAEADYFDVASYGGASTTFCAKLELAIAAAYALRGSYVGTFDARGVTSQNSNLTCSPADGNVFASLPASGDTSIHILMPYGVVTINAGWSYTTNDVVIDGQGQEGNSVLQAGTSFPPNTNLISMGSPPGNYGDLIRHLRLSCNGNLSGSGSVVYMNQLGEYSGLEQDSIVGCNSEIPTADAVICNNCINSHLYDIAVSGAGDNNAITYKSSAGGFDNIEGNLIQRITVNNTGDYNGLCGVNFAAVPYAGHSTFNQIHAEGFNYALCVGSGMEVQGSGIDTTGLVTNTDLWIANGGYATVSGIHDLGKVTYLVQDLNFSQPIPKTSFRVGGGFGYLSFYSTGPVVIQGSAL